MKPKIQNNQNCLKTRGKWFGPYFMLLLTFEKIFPILIPADSWTETVLLSFLSFSSSVRQRVISIPWTDKEELKEFNVRSTSLK